MNNDSVRSMTNLFGYALIADLIMGRKARAGESGNLLDLFGSPVVEGPRHPGPWYNGIDWKALLGGEPLELRGDDW
jgi:hypothetical protein